MIYSRGLFAADDSTLLREAERLLRHSRHQVLVDANEKRPLRVVREEPALLVADPTVFRSRSLPQIDLRLRVAEA